MNKRQRKKEAKKLGLFGGRFILVAKAANVFKSALNRLDKAVLGANITLLKAYERLRK